MKKTIKKMLGIILACTTVMMSVCACGNSTDDKEKITVTFMNGDEKLGEVTATAGEKLSDYEKYEKVDGFEFLGWFETPTFLETSKKDLKTVTFETDNVNIEADAFADCPKLKTVYVPNGSIPHYAEHFENTVEILHK